MNKNVVIECQDCHSSFSTDSTFRMSDKVTLKAAELKRCPLCGGTVRRRLILTCPKCKSTKIKRGGCCNKMKCQKCGFIAPKKIFKRAQTPKQKHDEVLKAKLRKVEERAKHYKMPEPEQGEHKEQGNSKDNGKGKIDGEHSKEAHA